MSLRRDAATPMFPVLNVPPLAGMGLNGTTIGPSTPGGAMWMCAAVMPVSPLMTQSATIVLWAVSKRSRIEPLPALATAGTSADPSSAATNEPVPQGSGVAVGVAVAVEIGVGVGVGPLPVG